MFEQSAAASRAGKSGQHAGISGSVDNPIAGGEAGEITGRPQVPMNEFHTQPREAQPVGVGPWTCQVVQPGNAEAFHSLEQAFRQRTSHEPTHTGDEDPHPALTWRRRIQLAAISSKITGSVLVILQAG